MFQVTTSLRSTPRPRSTRQASEAVRHIMAVSTRAGPSFRLASGLSSTSGEWWDHSDMATRVRFHETSQLHSICSRSLDTPCRIRCQIIIPAECIRPDPDIINQQALIHQSWSCRDPVDQSRHRPESNWDRPVLVTELIHGCWLQHQAHLWTRFWRVEVSSCPTFWSMFVGLLDVVVDVVEKHIRQSLHVWPESTSSCRYIFSEYRWPILRLIAAFVCLVWVIVVGVEKFVLYIGYCWGNLWDGKCAWFYEWMMWYYVSCHVVYKVHLEKHGVIFILFLPVEIYTRRILWFKELMLDTCIAAFTYLHIRSSDFHIFCTINPTTDWPTAIYVLMTIFISFFST